MKILKIERHKNGMFYVNDLNRSELEDVTIAVDIETYRRLNGDYDRLTENHLKLIEDHERNLGLLKILLKSTNFENFIKVQ